MSTPPNVIPPSPSQVFDFLLQTPLFAFNHISHSMLKWHDVYTSVWCLSFSAHVFLQYLACIFFLVSCCCCSEVENPGELEQQGSGAFTSLYGKQTCAGFFLKLLLCWDADLCPYKVKKELRQKGLSIYIPKIWYYACQILVSHHQICHWFNWFWYHVNQ